MRYDAVANGLAAPRNARPRRHAAVTQGRYTAHAVLQLPNDNAGSLLTRPGIFFALQKPRGHCGAPGMQPVAHVLLPGSDSPQTAPNPYLHRCPMDDGT